MNWGIDDSIADYLEALNLDQYDGMNNAGGLFGRDQDLSLIHILEYGREYAYGISIGNYAHDID